MSTQTTTFAALGVSPAVSVEPGQSITYSSTGTFTGYVVFQRSRTNGATWETIQDAAVDTNLAGGSIKNESSAAQRFRFQAFDTDALTAWTGTCAAVIVDNNDTVRQLKDDNGRVYATVTDDGISLAGDVTVGDDLAVTGNTTFTGTVSATGAFAPTGGIDFNGLAPAASPILFTGMTLAANSNLLRGIGVNPTRVSGWTAFTGTVGATPAQVYTDYRELHTSGVAEILGFGMFPYMDSGATCAAMLGGQDIAYVSTGATVLTAAGAPGTGIFSRWGKTVIDGATFNSGGVAGVQFLSFQANVTDVQAEDTAMQIMEVASGGVKNIIKFQCTAAKGATNFIEFTDDNGEPASLTNTGVLNDISATANAGWIRVKVGSSARYIPLYELKA